MRNTTLKLYSKQMNKEFIIILDYLSNIIHFVNDLPDSEYMAFNLNCVTAYIPDEILVDVDIHGVNFDRFFIQYNDVSPEFKFYSEFKKKTEGIIQKKYPIFMKRKLLRILLEHASIFFIFTELDSPFFCVSIQNNQYLLFDHEMIVVKQAPLTINRKEFEILAKREWNRLRVKSHRKKIR